MTEAFPPPVGLGVIRHTTGDFSGAAALRRQALETMSRDDPKYPGVLSTLALGADREGRCDAALALATEAYDFPTPAGEFAERNNVRRRELPSVQINAGTVFLRAAARLRLAGNFQVATPLHQRARTAFAAARIGIDGINGTNGLRDDYHPHQWGINLQAREAALAAVEGKPWEALCLGLGTLALGFFSESPRFVQHTSRIAQTVRKEALTAGAWPVVANAKAAKALAWVKGKTVYRGAVAAALLPATALPVLRNRRFVQNFRDRVLLHVS